MACEKAVLKFLEDHNRPFSISDIQSSVPGNFGKSATQKALDNLVANQKVMEKVYGKQKVYFVVQNNDATGNELKESLLEMDRKINETTIQLKEVSDQLREKSKLIKEVQGKVSLKDAIDQKVELDREIDSVKSQLSNYSDTEMICPKKKMAAEEEYERFVNAYKKRKRMCMDMVNAILENYPKTKKQLFEDIGLETDEDAGFSIEKL